MYVNRSNLTEDQELELISWGYGFMLEIDLNSEFVIDLTEDGDVEANPGPVAIKVAPSSSKRVSTKIQSGLMGTSSISFDEETEENEDEEVIHAHTE